MKTKQILAVFTLLCIFSASLFSQQQKNAGAAPKAKPGSTVKQSAVPNQVLVPFEDSKTYKKGFKDPRTGKVVIPAKYNDIADFYGSKPRFIEGLEAVSINDKWGYINKAGTIVIPLSYDRAENFTDGLAMVSKNEKYGFINKTGKFIIPLIYDYAYIFEHGVASVSQNSKYGYINNKGVFVIPMVYDDLRFFFGKLLAFKKNKTWGAADLSGKTVIPMVFDSIKEVLEDGRGLEIVAVKKGNVRSYYNFKGEPIDYKHLEPFVENSLYGFKDLENGQVVVPPKYALAEKPYNGMAAVNTGGRVVKSYGAEIFTGGKYGFVDYTGKEVIPCIYSNVSHFHEGLARVCKNDYYYSNGYIDKAGNTVVPFQEGFLGDFYKGYAEASTYDTLTKTTRYGLIDVTGKVVIPQIYERIQPFYNGLALVKKDGKFGFINKKSEVVIPIIYDEAYSFDDYSATTRVKLNGKTFKIDVWGIKQDQSGY